MVVGRDNGGTDGGLDLRSALLKFSVFIPTSDQMFMEGGNCSTSDKKMLRKSLELFYIYFLKDSF